MTAPARFTQMDIARGMKAAKSAGFTRVRVGIDVQGNIVIDASNESAEAVVTNPLDRLLGSK